MSFTGGGWRLFVLCSLEVAHRMDNWPCRSPETFGRWFPRGRETAPNVLRQMKALATSFLHVAVCELAAVDREP
jgi:hypothetical protein